jgi:hypothetical protein
MPEQQEAGETSVSLEPAPAERGSTARELLAAASQTPSLIGSSNGRPASGEMPHTSGEVLPPPAQAESLLDDPSFQLLMRFLVGAAIVGAEELLARVQRWDAQAPRPSESARDSALDEATNLELARYLVIGSMVWGRKRLVHALRTNLIGAPGQPPALLKTIDRGLDIWPLSALKAPLRRAAADVAATADERVREGWREEQAARWLARQTIGDIIDDFIDHLSQNENLAALVRDQLNQQSIGLATTVRDTGREWSATGDDLVETIVRRFFRRPPRKDLERSSAAASQSGVEDGRDG